MRKLLSVFAVGAFMVAGLALSMLPTSAQALPGNGVSLYCGGSDICEVTVSASGAPAPLHYAWSFNSNGTDAIYPANCTDQDTCMFYCPKKQGRIQASVTVTDANYQFIGSASSMAMCTSQPL
ncbi:hypothetical protein [Dyella sp. ASV21]|uniref:hypothetical protein n=1 Tax=Dyella sp. ASV21 TaxID=2795114 RepID=UPI0018EDD1B9|nr:hypothetical protein [Dyella sp. ASV21]